MVYRRLFGLFKSLLSIYMLSLLSPFCLAQAPDTLWTSQICGPYNVTFGRSVIESSDGGYIIAGTSMDAIGSHCIYITKLSNDGDSLWSSELEGWEGYSVIELSDGAIIVGGISYINGNHYDACIARVDEQGNTVWQKTLGFQGLDYCHSLAPTNDGGFVLTGAIWVSAEPDVLLAKLNNNGDTLWTRIYGIGDGQLAYSVKQTFDGGYIIAGKTIITGFASIYLIKTDSLGDVQWERSYGGDDHDDGFSVVQTDDGGYAITGTTQSYGNGYEDIFILKTDNDGNMEWMRTFGTSSNDFGSSIIQTSDGGLIAAGSWRSYHPLKYDVFLVKTDANGDSLWAILIGDSASSEYAHSINHTSDGGFIVAGSKSGDFYAIKLAAEPTGTYGDERLHPDMDMLISAYPNPFNANATIKYYLPSNSEISLSIYNILGQRVEELFEGLQKPGEHVLTWDASHFPSGIYFARLETICSSDNIKMILLK